MSGAKAKLPKSKTSKASKLLEKTNGSPTSGTKHRASTRSSAEAVTSVPEQLDADDDERSDDELTEALGDEADDERDFEGDEDEDLAVVQEKNPALLKKAQQRLLTRGKEQGYLTFDEIQDAMDAFANDRKVIAKLMAELEKAKIDLVDEPPGKERVQTKKAKKPEEDLTRSTDPVRMYLRKMGTVPLLTREGEVEIAKRIEQGEDAILEAALQCPTTLTAILNLGEDLRAGKIKGRDLVRDSDEDEENYDEEEVDRRALRQFDRVKRLVKKVEDADQSGQDDAQADSRALITDTLKKMRLTNAPWTCWSVS